MTLSHHQILRLIYPTDHPLQCNQSTDNTNSLLIILVFLCKIHFQHILIGQISGYRRLYLSYHLIAIAK
jgi:hypothetical protein